MTPPSISIVIPTLDRDAILLDTLYALLEQDDDPEILVVDQTASHQEDTTRLLQQWDKDGSIRWIQLEEPSIPHAMNVGLNSASREFVLFLDDDIVPGEGLAAKHLTNYADPGIVAVAGQVIQPWQSPADLPRPRHKPGIWEDLDFPFHGTRRAVVRNVMAGNLSVRRKAALVCGGFDEHFIGAAYRFETEFCRRLTRHGGKIVFDPEASVRHLKAEIGGTRVFGDGVRGSRIEHSVGAYYFAFLESSGLELTDYLLRTMCSTTFSKFYASRPWLIPKHFLCQFASIRLARRLYNERNSTAD